MKTLLIILALLLITLPSFGQSKERPEGIVIPVATLGDVTETRRQILQNTLIESLSSYYRLVPQDKFEEVQEKVFQEMDHDECTDDQCIMMIQEALQVENLFILQVIGEGQNTQMSFKWVGLDDSKVKTDVCKGCDTFELNERVEGLVRNLESVIPRGDFVTETVDEERLKKEREEELRRQREEELRKQRDQESIEKREEVVSIEIKDGDENKSQSSLNFITYPIQIPDSSKPIDGFRLNLGVGYNDKINGYDFGILNTTQQFEGLQIGLMGNINLNFSGYQFGLYFNYAQYSSSGHQLGLLNIAESTTGQYGGLLNISRKNNEIQIGLVNYSKNNNVQIGILNYSNYVEGVQIGLINYAVRIKGIQLGAINIIENSEIIGFFPIINGSF